MKTAVSVLTVARVEERHKQTHVSGVGKEALFNNDSLGWFATFRENNLAVRVAPPHAEPPRLSPGDRVRITIERVDG